MTASHRVGLDVDFFFSSLANENIISNNTLKLNTRSYMKQAVLKKLLEKIQVANE